MVMLTTVAKTAGGFKSSLFKVKDSFLDTED